MNRDCRMYIMMAILFFLCGCETVGAFGTGRMTSADVAYITHAGTLGKKTAPVNIDSIDADEEYEAPGGVEERPAGVHSRASNVDSWLEENLW